MTNDIGDIIISKLVSLPFIDRYAGVVKTIQYRDGEGKVKSLPASVRATLTECEQGRYQDLCPDSTKKSVLFLEDNGVRLVRQVGPRNYFSASYDLICWLNLPQLGYEGTQYAATAINGIIKKFPIKPFNSGVYQGISIKVQGQAPKNQNPYRRYSYDETVTQFLMHPFEAFVLQIQVEFAVVQHCLTVTAVGDPAPCQTSNFVQYVTIVDRETQEVIAQLTLGQVYEVEVLRQIIQTLTNPPPATIVQVIQ